MICINSMTGSEQSKAHERSHRIVLHYWGSRGGGSHVTLNLAKRLSSSSQNIEILLSLAQHNSEVEEFRRSGYRIIPFARPTLRDLWRKAWSLPRALSRHAGALAAFKPDAVIITMNSPFAWPFIRALQKRDLKVIYIAHDAEPHPGDYAATWQRVTQDLLIRRADRVVTLSNSVTRRLAERIPPSSPKTTMIPLEAVYPRKRAQLPARKAAGEPVRLLFYGRLLPYKGLDLMAEALKPLKDDPRWRLTLAGSGPLEQEVRSVFTGWPQVDLELGWISDQRATQLLSSHHLLLCPYREASQSGVIAEALSWAMPSLVMPTGALPEQIGHGVAGIIAETGDAEGLGRALRSILDQPSLLASLSHGAAKLLVERQNKNEWIKLIEAMTCQDRQ